MPQGTPFEATREAVQRMTEAAQDLQADFVDPVTGESVIENLFSTVGSAGGGQRNQSHIGRVAFEVVAPEDRTVPVTSPELVREWRERIGVLPGAGEEVSVKALLCVLDFVESAEVPVQGCSTDPTTAVGVADGTYFARLKVRGSGMAWDETRKLAILR